MTAPTMPRSRATMTLQARDLRAGDLIDGSDLLARLAALGERVTNDDYRAAEWRLWDVVGTSPMSGGLITLFTGRHGDWAIPATAPVIVCGSLTAEEG